MNDEATALANVESTYAHLEAVVRETAHDYRHHIEDALDRIIELTVIEQDDLTTGMSPIDLKNLRLQISGARQVAIEHVGERVDALDLETLAKLAEPGTTGNSYVDYDTLLSPLLDTTADLLAHSGYSTGFFASLRVGGNYSISRIPDIGTAAASATRRLDAAVEEYGKAKIAASELSKQARRDAAREAWARAI